MSFQIAYTTLNGTTGIIKYIGSHSDAHSYLGSGCPPTETYITKSERDAREEPYNSLVNAGKQSCWVYENYIGQLSCIFENPSAAWETQFSAFYTTLGLFVVCFFSFGCLAETKPKKS